MVTFHQPLELQYWFINVFSGSTDIFMLVSVLALTWFCSMFKMQMGTFLVLLVTYAAILAVATTNVLLILLILILAPLLFWITRRIVD